MSVPGPAEPNAVKRKGSVWRTVKAVLWAFVGLRARSESEKDGEQLNPLHIVIVALAGAGFFVGGLIVLATWMVGRQ